MNNQEFKKELIQSFKLKAELLEDKGLEIKDVEGKTVKELLELKQSLNDCLYVLIPRGVNIKILTDDNLQNDEIIINKQRYMVNYK